MLAKNAKRNDKLCLQQNNSLLLSRLSYRVRVTPQKKKKKKGENNRNWKKKQFWFIDISTMPAGLIISLQNLTTTRWLRH